ncbi:MAG: RNA-binding protein [Oscillospiraceae bacterium]|nr:RNA-binding protein [Oscillospiraceae bacterium]
MYCYKVGDIVLSLAGRDKKRLFAVVGMADQNHVYLSDGKSRKTASPKKKKIKHIKFIKNSEGEFSPADAVVRKILAGVKTSNK